MDKSGFWQTPPVDDVFDINLKTPQSPRPSAQIGIRVWAGEFEKLRCILHPLKTFLPFIGQSEAKRSDRKWQERGGHDRGRPAGVKVVRPS